MRPSADSSFRCDLITDFSGLERLAGEWDRLFRSNPPPGGMFQSWKWTRAFWTARDAELSLCAPVLFRGDRVVAILPVAVQGDTARKYSFSLALELAYLRGSDDPAALYEQMMSFLEVL